MCTLGTILLNYKKIKPNVDVHSTSFSLIDEFGDKCKMFRIQAHIIQLLTIKYRIMTNFLLHTDFWPNSKQTVRNRRVCCSKNKREENYCITELCRNTRIYVCGYIWKGKWYFFESILIWLNLISRPHFVIKRYLILQLVDWWECSQASKAREIS